jgi:hypothetical protein
MRISESKDILFLLLAIAVAFYICTAVLHFIFVPVLEQAETFCVPGHYDEDRNECYKFVSEREESIWYHNSRMHSRSIAINLGLWGLSWVFWTFLVKRSDPSIAGEDLFVFGFLFSLVAIIIGQTAYLNLPPPYGWWPDALRTVHSAHISYELRFL